MDPNYYVRHVNPFELYTGANLRESSIFLDLEGTENSTSNHGHLFNQSALDHLPV